MITALGHGFISQHIYFNCKLLKFGPDTMIGLYAVSSIVLEIITYFLPRKIVRHLIFYGYH